MFHPRLLMPALLIGLGIILGCQPTPSASNSTSFSTKSSKALDEKFARLEADLKKANDEIAKLSNQMQKNEQLAKEVARERDELRVSLKERTSERDVVTAKLEGFRKNVKDLLGQVDAAMASPYKPTQAPEPVTVLPPPSIPSSTDPVQ